MKRKDNFASRLAIAIVAASYSTLFVGSAIAEQNIGPAYDEIRSCL